MRAPPPRRAATMPPTSEPAPQMPSSGPAAAALPSASAAATTATSTAPNTTPSATRTTTSVRMAGARSEPPRGRAAAVRAATRATRAGRRRRRWRRAARRRRAPARRRWTTRRRPRASGRSGDPGQLDRRSLGGVCAVQRLGSPKTAGRIVRRHAPTGGGLSPSTAARPRARRAARRPAAPRSRRARGPRPAPRRAGPWSARAVDQPSEQRPADAERHAERARDDAGRAQRAGQPLGVDEQPDAEHRHRQAGEHRDGQQAKGAGSGGEGSHGSRG